MTDRDMLELMLANDTEPILDADTVTELLLRARVVDASNRWPTEDDYEDTYNLNIAAARGWRLKAARVAADYDLDVDGKGLSRSQMAEAMLKMASGYARLGGPRAYALSREIAVDEEC